MTSSRLIDFTGVLSPKQAKKSRSCAASLARVLSARFGSPGQSQKIAMIGALDFVSRQLTVVTSQTKRSADFITLLERLDQILGPKPGAACTPAAIVLDNGSIHTSKATRAALEARKHWLTPEWLAKYAPELNDIERDWKIIKTHHLAHKTFENRDSLQATSKRTSKPSIQAEKPDRWPSSEALLSVGA